MNYISYTTIVDLINVPHSWVNKCMSLEKFRFTSYNGGQEAHRALQQHVSGQETNPLLGILPTFSVIEEVDQDERCRIDYHINDDFILTGYFDGFDPERGDILEAKSYETAPWSLGRFNSLMQWRLYALALTQRCEKLRNLYGVTMPKDLTMWSPKTVRVFEIPIQDKDLKAAQNYLEKAVDIIKNMDTLAYQPTTRHCGYKDCLFGCEFKKQELQSEI